MTKSNTASLLDTLNASREETIVKHYGAASAELQEKIKSEPLRTSFQISAGCVSKDVTDEIARRFNDSGIDATSHGGFFRTYFYVKVKVSLPSHLVSDTSKVEN